MNRREKILEKFRHNPSSLKFGDIKALLIDLGFDEIKGKGSHVKMKHVSAKIDYVFSVHNNDCKDFYKKQILKKLLESNLL